MTKVVLAVPYRATPSRAVVWDELRERYAALPYRLSVSDSDPRAAFNVSEARNRAVEAVAEDWDVLVHVDADTWIDPAALDYLIAVALSSRRVVVPERAVYMQRDQVTVRHELRLSAGGVVVFPRRVWEAVGSGYDERFRGWGFEDQAMKRAIATLTGDLLYAPGVSVAAFYHDEEDGAWNESIGRWADGSIPALVGDYEIAVGDALAMARIVAEARDYREWWRGCGRIVR